MTTPKQHMNKAWFCWGLQLAYWALVLLGLPFFLWVCVGLLVPTMYHVIQSVRKQHKLN